MTASKLNVFSFELMTVVVLIMSATLAQAQQQTAANGWSATVPNLVQFSGAVKEADGQSIVKITFSLYKNQQGGSPLWTELQNLSVDETGHYTVSLGVATTNGIPSEIFTTGEARWLSVQVEDQPADPRILLLSVPYAMKAADAETLGGRPASAFLLATPESGSSTPSSPQQGNSVSPTIVPPITGSGKLNFLSKWTGTSSLGSSLIFQSSSNNIGMGTTNPGAKLDVVNNAIAVRGTSTATANGTGVLGVTGTSTTSPGDIAVMGLNKSQFGTAGVFNTTSANSEILLGQFNGNEVFAVNPQGQVFGNSGYFSNSIGVQAVSGIQTQNCTTCNAGFLGSLSAGVYAQGGVSSTGVSSPAGWFISESPNPGDLAFRVQNNLGTDVFYLTNTGYLHTGTLVVDGINNTDTIGVEAFAFGNGGATGSYGEADSSGDVGAEGYSYEGTSVLGLTHLGISAQFGNDSNTAQKCVFDATGDLGCYGTITSGVPLSTGRTAALYAVESPENWFEDFGSAKLSDGGATVVLDPSFAQTINTRTGYHVFVTPNADCKGLYVTAKTATSFSVHELGEGHSNIEFDYRVVAHRKGYEAARLTDVTDKVSMRVPPRPSKKLQ